MLIAAVVESMLGRRALAVATLGFLLALTLAPWLRPPLQQDLRGTQIAYAVFGGVAAESDEAGFGFDRAWRVDSVATPLVAVCVIGVVVVVFDPNRLPIVSGVAAALAIAGSAAVVLNHPRLIEACNSEFQQRARLARLLTDRSEHALAGQTPGRTRLLSPQRGLVGFGTEPDLPEHGWHYLVVGPWLAAVALVATAVTTRGRLWRRFGVATVWLLVGVGLSVAVTHRRLAAEWHWSCSRSAGIANRFDEARESLDRLAGRYPELMSTRRVLLARGEIDARAGVSTPEAAVFLASHNKDHGARYAELSALGGGRVVDDLRATAKYNAGLSAFRQRRPAAAEKLWREGARAAPWRLDCRAAQAVSLELAKTAQADRVAAMLLPIVDQIADRAVRADLQNVIGDAYFESARVREARRYYAESVRSYNLPKQTNLDANEALLGM